MTLGIDVAETLGKNAPYLELVAADVRDRGQLKFGNVKTSFRLTGTNAAFARCSVTNSPMADSSLDAEDQIMSRVAALNSIRSRPCAIDDF
jgi:hypothetical protein